jgi:hypothetical protein
MAQSLAGKPIPLGWCDTCGSGLAREDGLKNTEDLNEIRDSRFAR